MTKIEYEQKKQELITRLGEPEWDMREPVNDSAKELVKLKNEYKSQNKQQELVKEYKAFPAVPIYLSDTDLELFNNDERSIIEDYFQDTNQTASQLAKKYKGWTRQRWVALTRSGPFSILCDRLYATLMRLEVNNALLKAIRDGNPKIIERMAEQTGALKSQEMNLNINKPLALDDPELAAKLKELGDSRSNEV